MLAYPLVALIALAAPGARPDAGARLLEDGSVVLLEGDGSALVSVPGLQRFASSSSAVKVTQVGSDRLALRAEALGGTQLDAWVDGGAHLRARVFVRLPKAHPDLGIDFLPLTHAADVQVRELADRGTVIRARLDSVEDAVALEILAEAHPRLVVLAGLRSSRVDQAVSALNAGLPAGLRAVWAGDRVVLRGEAEPDVKRAAEKRIDTHLGLLVNAVRAGRIFLEADAELDRPRMRLSVGAQNVLTVPGLSRVGVGDPAIANVEQLGPDQVLVVGVGEGSTWVQAWARDGSVQRYWTTVEAYDGCYILDASLGALLPRRREVRLEVVGDRLLVAGRISSVEQALATADVLRAFPNIMLLDPPREDVLEAQTRAVNAALVRSGVSTLHAVRTGLKLWFDGPPRELSDLAIAQGWADALFEPFARLPRKLSLPTTWPARP